MQHAALYHPLEPCPRCYAGGFVRRVSEYGVALHASAKSVQVSPVASFVAFSYAPVASFVTFRCPRSRPSFRRHHSSVLPVASFGAFSEADAVFPD
jgi:hypothetical protein